MSRDSHRGKGRGKAKPVRSDGASASRRWRKPNPNRIAQKKRKGMVSNVLSRQPYSTAHIITPDATPKQKGIALAANFFASAGCTVGYPDKAIAGCDLWVIPADMNGLPTLVHNGMDGTAAVEVFIDDNYSTEPSSLTYPLRDSKGTTGLCGNSDIWFHIYDNFTCFNVSKTDVTLEFVMRCVKKKLAKVLSGADGSKVISVGLGAAGFIPDIKSYVISEVGLGE
jgi:hypothetical protein